MVSTKPAPPSERDDIRQGLSQGHLTVGAPEAREKCRHHVDGSIARGKDLARLFHLGRHPFGFDQRDQLGGPGTASAECRNRPGGP